MENAERNPSDAHQKTTSLFSCDVRGQRPISSYASSCPGQAPGSFARYRVDLHCTSTHPSTSTSTVGSPSALLQRDKDASPINILRWWAICSQTTSGKAISVLSAMLSYPSIMIEQLVVRCESTGQRTGRCPLSR